MIRSCFSDNDIFFRMGGDEFIIYCVNITDELQCKSFINNLYEEIEEIQIEFINNKSIGISLGCCIYNKGATNYNGNL